VVPFKGLFGAENGLGSRGGDFGVRQRVDHLKSISNNSSNNEKI
jgi:hypothetical protein